MPITGPCSPSPRWEWGMRPASRHEPDARAAGGAL